MWRNLAPHCTKLHSVALIPLGGRGCALTCCWPAFWRAATTWRCYKTYPVPHFTGNDTWDCISDGLNVLIPQPLSEESSGDSCIESRTGHQ